MSEKLDERDFAVDYLRTRQHEQPNQVLDMDCRVRIILTVRPKIDVGEWKPADEPGKRDRVDEAVLPCLCKRYSKIANQLDAE